MGRPRAPDLDAESRRLFGVQPARDALTTAACDSASPRALASVPELAASSSSGACTPLDAAQRELVVMRHMLADSKEEHELEVSRFREELAEKQRTIDALKVGLFSAIDFGAI